MNFHCLIFPIGWFSITANVNHFVSILVHLHKYWHQLRVASRYNTIEFSYTKSERHALSMTLQTLTVLQLTHVKGRTPTGDSGYRRFLSASTIYFRQKVCPID